MNDAQRKALSWVFFLLSLPVGFGLARFIAARIRDSLSDDFAQECRSSERLSRSARFDSSAVSDAST